MSLFVLDTDILSLYQRGHSVLSSKLNSYPASELAITVITVEEELAAWYSLLRKVHDPDDLVMAYTRLAEAVPVLARWQIPRMNSASVVRYEKLKSMNLNVRKMDLRIAAITLEHGGVLVTRNTRDFQRIPSLQVEDWST
jgi:tRNA(fMet)-specific endonuclease VapC